MKVLILGGTGAMGIHLVDLLIERGLEIYVTTRKNRQPQKNIYFIQGNAQEFSFLQDLLCQDWDVIVDFMTYRTESFKARVNLLLKATKQYVFLSSARVYAESKTAIKEDSPRLIDESIDKDYLETDEYALRKARQENILMKSNFSNWTIIRPYITYAENRLQLGVLEKEDWLYRALKGRTIVFSKEISEKLTTMTYGLDVANGICSLMGNSTSYGQAFQITTNESIKWNDVLNIYLNVLEKKLGFRPNVLLQNTDTFLSWRLGKYQIIYDRLYDRTFDNCKMAHHIDINKFERVKLKLTESLEIFLETREFIEIDWKMEALKDRYTKEHVGRNEIDGFKNKSIYMVYRYFNWVIEVIIKPVYRKFKIIF